MKAVDGTGGTCPSCGQSDEVMPVAAERQHCGRCNLAFGPGSWVRPKLRLVRGEANAG